MMVIKGYYYVVNLGTASSFYFSIDPGCPGSYARRSIVASELGGI